MTFAAGTRLGHYEIHGSIGAGGMGEVYVARDTRLNRDVALKVLPDVFSTDPDRLARFTREAQTLPADIVSVDATPDRQRFLVIAPERTGTGSVTVVQNWLAALATKR